MRDWFGSNKYQLIVNQDETTIPTENITPVLPEPTRDGLRPEIQGLRGIAISAVLLFHMWGNIFIVGYLGVDVFFVISGYLMILLLSRKQELTIVDSTNFYYRRVKRIVPTYLLVIASILISCHLLISEFEFGQVASEAIPSLFFYSNFPSVHKTNYFDVKSKHQFFLHTWSLSVELQFYLFVPLLILAIYRLRSLHFCFTLIFISILCLLSFLRQLLSSSNAKHMTLDARVWQFLFGFLAHFAYEHRLFEKCGFRLIVWLRDTIPTLLLVSLLLFQVVNFMEQQIQRLLVTFLAALIIAIRQDSSSILNLDILVNLGDVSYSVYLAHWPLYNFHKYLTPDLYEDGKEAEHIVGSYLIGVSILIGYIIEKLFKRVLVFVKSWYSLIQLLFILYLVCGISLFYLHKDAITLVEDKPLSKEGEEKRLQDTLMLWRTRKDDKPFPNNQTMALNAEIAYFYETCHNKTRSVPSSFKDLSAFEKICHESGRGEKNVVVFGNSHAYKPFLGIVQIFKPIARRITLLSTSACVPVSKEHQFHSLSMKRKVKCQKFIEDGVKIMQGFDYPIHIIIPIFGWYQFKEYSTEEASKLQAETQLLFSNLSAVSKEVVFVPMMNLVFTRNPLRVVQERLKSGTAIGPIGDTREKLSSNQLSIRRVMEGIECPKCVKINWLDLWCDNSGFCSGVDSKRHLSYFYDEHHCTTYGAMFIGDYLLKAYKNYMKTNH